MTYVLSRATRLLALAAFLAVGFCPAGVRGGSFFYQFANVFAGTTPDGSPAWVSSLFSDVAPGTVQLKISANNLANGEFLSALFFNLDPSLNPAKLSFSLVGDSGGFTLPTIQTGANDFKADNEGKFDINFTFSQNAGHQFTGNDYIIYDVTSSAFTLTASDFDALSTAAGGCAQLLAAAEIAGIPGTCSTTSTGWISPCGLTLAPEPRAVSMLALGGGFWAAAGWWRNRTKRA